MAKFQASSSWSLAQRLNHYTDKSGGPDACWPWLGGKFSEGYGQARWNGVTRGAHCVTWEDANGPIPEGLFVLHRCDNPPCCNLRHLFLGTPKDNMADKVAKGRHPHGEMTKNAKLKQGDVIAILADQRPHKQIAAQYAVGRSTISMIKSRQNWKHVT